METLACFEVSDLVYWTTSILTSLFGDQTIDPSAVACSYTVSRAELYVEAVGQAEARRYDIGMSMHRGLEAAEALSEIAPEAAAVLSQEVIRWNDKSEVEIHLFTVCADQVRRMLAVVTETLGISLDDDDANDLASYRPLRNQFEHLDERLPGVESGGSIVLNEARFPSVLSDVLTCSVSISRRTPRKLWSPTSISDPWSGAGCWMLTNQQDRWLRRRTPTQPVEKRLRPPD